MFAILYWLIYMVCGIAAVGFLLPKKKPVIRVWLGMTLGLCLMMWLPALCAFFMDFTVAAQCMALVPLALLTCGA